MLKKCDYAVDYLLIDDSLSKWIKGNFIKTQLVKNKGYLIELNKSRRGEYVSRVIKTKFPVNEIVPSYNIKYSEGCGFSIRLRISSDNKKWSPWFYLGKSGKVNDNSKKILENSWGKVIVDYLVLAENKFANYIQYKITFFSNKSDAIPSMSLFAISYSNSTSDKKLYTKFRKKVKIKKKDWNKKLPVPFRSQLQEDKKYRWYVCSPTCVSMLLEYYGIKEKTRKVVKKAYDDEYKIYGIWPKAINTAVQYGLKGWLQRFRNWDDVKYQISINQPVIASIKFKKGVLSNAPIPRSRGHIIVITGFDKNGDVYVNDPVGKTEAKGMLVYKAEELAKTWFDYGGVGYIIKK